VGEPALASQRPDAGIVRPAKVLELAAGRPTTPLWRNEAGGLTFRIEGVRESVVKWNPPGSSESLAEEAERLRWLSGRVPAPRVIEAGADASGEWLLSEAVPARSAVDPRWLAEQNTLLGDDGGFGAIVDAARVGVADRWADLAVASLRLDWNYGPGCQSTFFAAYGIEPDERRLAYYRALWNAE